MAKKALTVNLHLAGARETLAALRTLPKDASKELRDASKRIADDIAEKVKTAAVAEGRQARVLARTVKAHRDRVPVVVAGGMTRLGRHRVPAYTLLFGSEFGMNRRTGWYARERFRASTGRQYKPHRGQQGRWFFPTVEAEQAEISRQWREAADSVIAKFAAGG